MIRILLVEDHTSTRQAMAYVIDREPDLTVVAQAGSLAEARVALGGSDVAVVDLTLPDGDGMDLIGDLCRLDPAPAVLVLTASFNPVRTAQAVEAGASGILHKSASLDDIVRGIRRLAAGDWLLSPREVAEMLRAATRYHERERETQATLQQLTPREREVLQALADGLEGREIARRLSISVPTERTHMMNILSKLGVHTQLQALLFAIRHGAVKIR